MKNTNFLLLSILAILIFSTNSCQNSTSEKPKTQTSAPPLDKKWWKEAVVYQIYPRSFQDSDGDGIGDLKGIISRLDYIKSLGVDAVWLNPIYASPNADNGYDISDYQAIMRDFGTMDDFNNLLKGMHDRGIKLVMDLVANHCSDEHEWFKQSRSSRDNPYRDYFHWWPAEKGKPTPRFSFFDVESDAWQFDKKTNAYYLHIFAEKQPDLNWENPKVREEIYKMMRFWLDKGVDGFRMDAFQYICKDTTWPVFPPGYEKDIIKWYGNGPHLHDHIQEMNREVLSKYDIMTVAEGAGTSPADAMKWVDPDRHELNMAYHFEGMDMGQVAGKFKVPDPAGLDLVKMKQIYTRWSDGFAERGWVSMYLASHDQPRMLTRWGNDSPEFRDVSSKMLNTFILSMRGTPYCYYGDEIGMSNIKFDKIEYYQDIETINQYKKAKAAGEDLQEFLKNQKIMARDNGRTPFQWDATPTAGFSTGKSWLKTNPNCATTNAAAQENDPNSPLNYFRKMIRLRKENEVLIYGKYTLLDAANPDVYSYSRELNGRKLLVLLNFKAKTASANTGLDLSKAKILIGNYALPSKNGELKPYESVIFEL